MAHRYDEINLTVARQFAADGVRRYIVWLRRGSAVAVHVYEATDSEDAKRQAVAELKLFEAMYGAI